MKSENTVELCRHGQTYKSHQWLLNSSTCLYDCVDMLAAVRPAGNTNKYFANYMFGILFEASTKVVPVQFGSSK